MTSCDRIVPANDAAFCTARLAVSDPSVPTTTRSYTAMSVLSLSLAFWLAPRSATTLVQRRRRRQHRDVARQPPLILALQRDLHPQLVFDHILGVRSGRRLPQDDEHHRTIAVEALHEALDDLADGADAA